jgi:hypothetical protein
MCPEPDSAFAPVYRPRNHVELESIKMILEREGVRYYVVNEEGARGASSAIGDYEMIVMVETPEAARCQTILAEELDLR